MPFKLGILGLDHGHIFGMYNNLKERGCVAATYWTNGTPVTEPKFNATFPEVGRVDDPQQILDDPKIKIVLISCVPADRAALAIRAMEAGKDVMVDKPGCTTLEQLSAIRQTQARTGQIWSVNFSERFQVPAVTRASELVADGAIGRVIQTLGIGPHKQNLQSRPDWFFKRERYGGILTDIASHQVDQFLYFTQSTTAQITHAHVENSTRPDLMGFQDFGELGLRSNHAHGYIRVDWFTPDALPTWGDGRLFILGTDGQIELRKYTDIGHPHQTDTLYLVNGHRNERIDCRDAGRPYFANLVADVLDRTETAMPQSHPFEVMSLAIQAQTLAENK
jgi:predicted dehydrogenase